MKQKFLIFLTGTFISLSCFSGNKQIKNDLRAPAYPLITIDPYTSAWAFTDNLYDGSVKHWTGKNFPLLGIIKVDGETYRFMGKETAEMDVMVQTSEQKVWEGKYTTIQPSADWMKEDFDDTTWKTGKGAFGTISKYTESMAKTDWMEESIWVRRTVEIPAEALSRELYFIYTNDDEAEFYINGVKISDVACCNKNAQIKLSGRVRSALKKGKNTIAAYCHNSVANGLLDFGIVAEKENSTFFKHTATQKFVDVQATQTHYAFTCGPIDLNLTFTAPLLMDNLKLMSRPVNYITYSFSSNDGQKHDVQIYFEAAANWALDTPYQKAASECITDNKGLVFLKTGSKDQNILGKKGDDVRIDWGYFYLVAEQKNTVPMMGNTGNLRNAFIQDTYKGKNTNPGKNFEFFAFGTDGKELKQGEVYPANTALIRDLGKTKLGTGKIMLGYDDLYSIQYFGENLRPYWNADGKSSIVKQFEQANVDYKKMLKKCTAFDQQLMKDAIRVGGKQYADLCALAYRQSVAAHKLVQAPNGELLFLSKENFSNGSIGTVDITYPSAPLYLLYNTELVKGLLNHIFYYSESGKWTKPFAAHDIGTYPLANGQTYGGDMPLEETCNMLIITAALAAREGNAKYAEKHWDVLTVWTNYLVKEGLDPENQLCTDDFAGHFAHNTNLSIKAIMGIASYGYLSNMLNKKDLAEKYTNIAKEMAAKWMTMADDGDHYRLTFDKPGTWSQKYNLIWDKLLKFNIFPSEVAEKEIAYYLTKQNKYGLPLDNRKAYSKADWIIWTATLANDKATFEEFISPLYKYVNETPTRVPMSDWFWTTDAKQSGFQARSVVGGYFIKMLEEKMK
ncbi:MAG: DUF4965 domain-containing protein [Bacteroidales bacterium]|nr:DUF4965 domain-containing protein [Bacteroidales bacterium]